jgi:hypothetical protein
MLMAELDPRTRKDQEMKNRRKKVFIDRAVQGALARRIILHWIIFFCIVSFALPLWQIYSRIDLSSPFSTLILQGWAESAPVFVILLATLPIFIWDTVKLSHRFAGPMYRLQKAIQDIAAGERPQSVGLRKGDFWINVAEDFNAMLERLAREEDQERLLVCEDTAPSIAPVGAKTDS